MSEKDNLSNNKSTNKSKKPISAITTKIYNLQIKYL